ncbi:MAG: hypothetical protein ACI85K_003707 [Hyphomicrobiaceae bacterium]
MWIVSTCNYKVVNHLLCTDEFSANPNVLARIRTHSPSPLRSALVAERLKARDDIKQLLVDETLAQTME